MRKILIIALAAYFGAAASGASAQTFSNRNGKLVLAGSGGTDLTNTLTLTTAGVFGAPKTYTFPVPSLGLFHSTAGGVLSLGAVDLSTVDVTNVLGSTNGGTGVNNAFTITVTGGNITLNGPATFSGTSSGTNTGDVTLAGQNYLSLTNQVITANPIDLTGTNVTGQLKAGSFPILTGDATTTGGSLATSVVKIKGNTIPANASGALINNGTGTLSWTAVPTGSGTVSGTNTGDVTLSGTANYLSLAAGQILSQNAIDITNASNLSGALRVANGGTGIASYAIGDVIYASAATTLSKLPAPVTNGSILTYNTGTPAPAWTAILPPANGGTGIANANTSTITLGGPIVTANSFTTSGNFALTLTTTGTTNVTLPTSGTLLSSTGGGLVSGLTTNGAVYAASATSLASTAALTNGQLLVGSTGLAPVAATITGTSNQVIVSNGAGSITLSTPQNINTTSSPSFTGLSVTGAGGGFTTAGVVHNSNAGLLSSSLVSLTADVSGILPPLNGGTGIANANTSTITLGGPIVTANSFTTSGNFALTLTTTGTTNVTLPTSGTLSTTGNSVNYNSSAVQNTATTTGGNYLFNVAYGTTNAAAAAGAVINSTTTNAASNATGLAITSVATATATSTGLTVSSTGGANNYAATFTNGSVGIGTAAPNTSLDIVKDVSTREFANATAFGASTDNVSFDAGTNQFGMVRLGGAPAGAFTITSIAGPQNGKRMTIYNATGQTMTLANQSVAAGATPANKIITSTGADVTVATGGSATLVYSNGDSKWILQGTSNGNSGAILSGLTANGAVYATSSSALTSTVGLTDGQLLIGSSTGVPTAANITAGSNITVTNGHNTISIAATIPGGLTGFAAPAANSVNVSAPTAGSATTAMRSDAKLQLDQSIIPTWTGNHTFSAQVVMGGATPNVTLDVVKDFATREVNVATVFANGSTNNNQNLDAAGNLFGFARLSGVAGGAFTITGFTGGFTGKRITIYNSTTQTMTLANQTTSAAANQIFTGTGANVAIPTGGSADIIYSGSQSLWILKSTSNGNAPSSATNWQLAGNAPAAGYNGTTGSFVGTTNAQPFVLATTAAQPIDFYTNNTAVMRLNTNSFLSVGGTFAPNAPLDVENSNPGHATLYLHNTSSTGFSSIDFVNDAGTTGNVGIGNSLSAAGFANQFYFNISAGTTLPMTFKQQSIEKMAIDVNGNIDITNSLGIGFTSAAPNSTRTLNVAGTAGTVNTRLTSLAAATPATTGGVVYADANGDMNRLAAPGSNLQVLQSATDGTLAWITPVLFARKTADVTLTASNTALQNDADLKLTLVANATYEFSGVVAYNGSNSASDLKLAFTFNGTTTSIRYSANQGGTAVAPSSVNASGTAISKFVCDAVPANALSVFVSGIIVVGGTGGTLQLQEAQNTSQANTTTILTNSHLKATRVQ